MLKVLLFTIGFFNMINALNAQVKDHPTGSQEDTINPYKPEALYDGDIKELAKTLEKNYAEKKPRPSGDSSVAFNAFVDRKPLNDLQDIQLVEGSKSAFADCIRQVLIDSGTAWKPMRQGGRAVKSIIRIQARLNSDGSITITTEDAP